MDEISISRTLSTRQCRALQRLAGAYGKVVRVDELAGIGPTSLEQLAGMGLAEQAPSNRFGKPGWRITADGWRCMYAKSYEECMAPGEPAPVPLRVWRWPLDGSA
jgi:hypothetical protein